MVKMTGKTHMAVGLAASSLLLKHPTNKIQFGIILGFAVIGALMPDVDQNQSILGHIINLIMISILLTLIALKFIGFDPQYSEYFHSHYMLQNILKTIGLDILPRSKLLTFLGMALMIINIALARITGHRKYAHSLVGFSLFSISIYLLFGETILPTFIIGFISHLLIDMLNHKDVNLFYPLKAGISLKIASTGGIIDHFLGLISIAVFLVFNLS